MRTTIDLPDDLHRLARELAHDRDESLSAVVVALLRRGLGQADTPSLVPAEGPRGLPVVSVGRAVTAEDVRTLEDE